MLGILARCAYGKWLAYSGYDTACQPGDSAAVCAVSWDHRLCRTETSTCSVEKLVTILFFLPLSESLSTPYTTANSELATPRLHFYYYRL